MNIKDLHTEEKEASTSKLFNGEMGSAITIQLQQYGVFKEHITKTPALLLCVSGTVTYNDENDKRIELKQGDFLNITPMIKHWLKASFDSQLILLK
jgi:quercetin dioxygenase-like cupin family protein